MASKYWIKLYHEILEDPKMGRLPDRLWRRTIEIFLLAGDTDDAGFLPLLDDIAWRFHLPSDELLEDFKALEAIGIIEQVGSTWRVINFVKRQSASSDAERMKRYRDRKRKGYYSSNDSVTSDVTIRNVDTDTDTDTDTEEEYMSANADFQALRKRWIELFPTKPKPRPNNRTLAGKAKTRMKDKHFRENWERAMERVTTSAFCLQAGWFDLGWFLKNDDNWQKCLAGNYDNKQGMGDNGKRQDPQRQNPALAALDEDQYLALLAIRDNGHHGRDDPCIIDAYEFLEGVDNIDHLLTLVAR